MPEYWSTQDLEGYFSSFATVVSCRALGDKGFGFVEFGSNGEAAEILARGAAMAFALDEGGCLRLNWARRGGADGARREEGGSVAGVAQPRPEELQRSAQEIAMAMDPALVQAATAMPRPQRNLVCYDDLL